MFTEEQVRQRHRQRWNTALEMYGNVHNVPSDELFLLSEQLRADHVAQIAYHRGLTGTHQLASFMREHSVAPSVMKEIVDVDVEIERRVKRVDKYKTVFDWCDANPGKVTTAAEVAEVGGFSLSTASNLIKDRIDYFRKIKRGEYIIRNPAAERAEEK